VDLLIESDESNYSVLREQQRSGHHSKKDQKGATSLAQNTGSAIVDGTNKAHAHVKQLISEKADESIDNRDDLKLQVPLNSRNDAVYLGTVYMGSPVSQPAKVVFDTGSEYLAITSVLCDDATAGNFKFKKYNALSGGFEEETNSTKGAKPKPTTCTNLILKKFFLRLAQS
jgi:hypothetical protein